MKKSGHQGRGIGSFGTRRGTSTEAEGELTTRSRSLGCGVLKLGVEKREAGRPLGHRRTGLGVSTGLGEGDGSRGGRGSCVGRRREEDGTGGTCCKESEVTGC